MEVLALRQQVAVLKRKRPRPTLNQLDRLFWTSLRRCWPRWAEVLVIVEPETVIGWHRAGFRLYWRWRSRPRSGRPKITEEIRELIRRLAQENADWGAPKIPGELCRGTTEQLSNFSQSKTELACTLNDCQPVKRCAVVSSLPAHSRGPGSSPILS